MRFAHRGKYQLLDFGFQPLQIPVSLGFVLNPLQSESYERHIRAMIVQPRFEGECLKNIIVASIAPIIFEVFIFDFVVELRADFFRRIVFGFCGGVRKERDIAFLPVGKRIILVAGILEIYTQRPFFRLRSQAAS